MTDEKILYRVTTFKANGSIWTKIIEWEKLGETITGLIDNFPHVMISRQTLKQNSDSYITKIGEKNVRKTTNTD